MTNSNTIKLIEINNYIAQHNSSVT